MIIYVVFVCEEILTVHFILTFFTFHFFISLRNESLYCTFISSLFHNDNLPFHKSRLSLQFLPGSSRDDLLLISTAILKIRVKSFYDFWNLNHLFQ